MPAGSDAAARSYKAGCAVAAVISAVLASIAALIDAALTPSTCLLFGLHPNLVASIAALTLISQSITSSPLRGKMVNLG